VSLVAVGISFVASAVIAVETVGKGLSIPEMDWNGDGATSIAEFFSTMDMAVYAENNVANSFGPRTGANRGAMSLGQRRCLR